MRSRRPPLRPIIKNQQHHQHQQQQQQQQQQHVCKGTSPIMSAGTLSNATDLPRCSAPPVTEGLTVDCAYSVAHSTASLLSVGFKSHFDWLFTPSSSAGNSNGRNRHALSEEAWKEKEERIRQVLAGSDETGLVDLWQLRELALSPGGLLTPFLRKQAWPKLVGCHEQVLRAACNAAPVPATVVPSSHDVQALKHDVSKTIWSIEEHLLASREQEKLHEERLQQFLAYEGQRTSSRVVRFAPHTRDNSCTSPTSLPSISRIDSTESHNHEDDEDHPEEDDRDDHRIRQTIASSPVVPKTIEAPAPVAEVVANHPGHHGLHPGEEDSLLSTVADDVEDLSAGGGYCPSDATHSTAFTLSSRVVRWRKASIAEQKILYNVVLSVLRTEAEPSDNFEDDRYHHFSGLQDLTALLMINLESPSLTSLVLTKLAGSHLRDALRKDRIMIDTAIAHAFLPLLECVDPELHRHLRRHGMTLPTFSRQWISCWFAQDVPDVEVASRLLDAFLVGHPLLPLYASVALLTDGRSQILRCDSHLSTLYSLLRGLPVQTLFEHDHRHSRAETVVATALRYMKDLPPSALVDLIRAQSDGSLVLDSISMFHAPPKWSQVPDAPSDYTLLKKAQELRMGSGESQQYSEESSSLRLADVTRTPLVHAAMGYSRGIQAKLERKSFVRSMVLVIVITGLATAYFHFVTSYGKTRSIVIPSDPRLSKEASRNAMTSAIATAKPNLAALMAPPPPPMANDNATSLSRKAPTPPALTSQHVLSKVWLPSLAHIIAGAAPTLQVATPVTTPRSSGVTNPKVALRSERPSQALTAWMTALVQAIEDAIPHSHTC